MTYKEIKAVERVTRAFSELMCNCVDAVGVIKKPTVKQLRKADIAIQKFNKSFKYFPYHEK